jgi:hydrogenase maturation protein HypF
MSAGGLTEAEKSTYPFSVESAKGMQIIRLWSLFEAIVNEVKAGAPVAWISAVFHRTVAQMIASMCELMHKETGLSTVALSGGCFQNRLLTRLTMEALGAQGFQILLHRHVPCNDGGLSLGQAVIAHFLNEGGT